MASTKTLQIYNTYLAPATDALMDLGSASLQFKDLYINGLAYIDGFGEDTDMGDFDIHSLDGLYGVDDNVYIDLGNDGRILIQADGAGTPFSTPDIDITGSVYFDDHIGLALDKQVQFGDSAVHIQSDDDGRLDLTADTMIDMNGIMLATDAIYFTQTDGAEKIDSDADGDIDIYAGTSIDFLINTTEQISLIDGVFQPTADNDIDLGTSSLKYKNLYLHGTLNAVCNNNEVVCNDNEIVFV